MARRASKVQGVNGGGESSAESTTSNAKVEDVGDRLIICTDVGNASQSINQDKEKREERKVRNVVFRFHVQAGRGA